MKKNKKKIRIIIILVLIALITFLGYYVVKNSNKNSLSLTENKWIEANKHNVVDVSLLNDIPVLSYEGEGLIYDYLTFITKNYSLKFNVIPYKLDENTEYDYKMNIVNNPSKTDITILKDNMVLIMSDDSLYNSIDDIENKKIGILAEDNELLTNYFIDKNIQFVNYNNYSDLKNSIVQARSNLNSNISSEIDGIIILKEVFTKEILENEYKISFQFNDLNKYFVLSTSGEKELNSILKKTFASWKGENYSKNYSSYLLNSYYKFKNISDGEQKKLNSKSYSYGFINYGIYNNIKNNKLIGLSGILLKDFNKFSNLSISYTKYNSINKLLKDFNNKKLDFLLNLSDSDKYSMDIYDTVGALPKKLVIISGIQNSNTIDCINSLKGKKVMIIKDSYLESYLINKKINISAYNNMSDLTKDFNSGSIALVDLENYIYYKTSAFKNSKINYISDINDKYNFVIRDTDENKLFENLFDFYLNFTSINELLFLNYEAVAYENINIVYILIGIIAILLIYLIADFSNHMKVLMKTFKKNKKVNLSKEDKIKYIDQLTSLKNRAYLNTKIEAWDDSEVYPQSIIIIDLNNISYINDNYGREEGDKVITEAANILIQHQLQNSEIIRTDGNEFLVYLVGYSEKQIIAYLRKLNKELKGLSHGFGAASGYSIITDAIKTVDDAVNEATLDMKTNKEDIDY